MNLKDLQKAVSIIVILLLTKTLIVAQGKHYNGLKMLGLSTELSLKTKGIGLHYEYFITNKSILKMSGKYEKTSFDLAKYDFYKFNPALLYNIYSESFIYINAKGGLLVGLEKGRSELLNDKYSQIFYGEEIGLNLELYISKKIKFEIEPSQFFLQKSKTQKTLFSVSVGVFLNI